MQSRTYCLFYNIESYLNCNFHELLYSRAYRAENSSFSPTLKEGKKKRKRKTNNIRIYFPLYLEKFLSLQQFNKSAIIQSNPLPKLYDKYYVGLKRKSEGDELELFYEENI